MNCKIIRSLCALAVAMLLLPLSSEAKKKDSLERKPFSRGIDNTPTVFIPKGTIGTGVAFSYNEYNIGKASDDVGYQMLFSMLQGMKGNLMNWSVAPHISYFFADNVSIGARFDYSRTSANLANASLAVSDDLALNVSDFNYFKHSYMGALTCRYYMSLAKSRRFGVFMELRAAGGYGQAENYRQPGGNKFGTYQDIYKMEIGLVPGFIVFGTENVAVEVSVGVLGFNWQKVCQLTNQVEYSEMSKCGANYKINLLSLALGVSFYIPTKK